MKQTVSPLVFVFVFLTLVVQIAIATDYCNVRCDPGVTHVGCNDGKPDKRCQNFKLYKLPTAAMNLLLNLHNTRRNRVALGQETISQDGVMEPASNMHELSWNYELANLSMYNVMKCQMSHDQCRSTDEFPYVGQNLGIYITNDRNAQKDLSSVIIRLVNDWYNEVHKVPADLLKSYRVLSDGVHRGHFTQMIWADATQIGCAVGTYGTLGRDFTILLCCDYSMGNMEHRPVYLIGPPRSQCPHGFSKKYTGLCGYNDKIRTNVKYVPQNVQTPRLKPDESAEDEMRNKQKNFGNDVMMGDVKPNLEEAEDMTKLQEAKTYGKDVVTPPNKASILEKSLVYIIYSMSIIAYVGL